ncbi:C40 family peptidase [Aquipuribacter nitratireducens]|uniref:C40 family peptidase n=1 Tax=Aquipuribacter nitratireducens TaxID=650104 RepID=A0ABW0GHT1_9MICO
MSLSRRSLLRGAVLVPGAVGAGLLTGPASAAVTPLAPVASITPAKGHHPLVPGWTGIKVKVVQHRLGLPASSWEAVDATTLAAVKDFQRANGLRVDGVVDWRTWGAMATGRSWGMDRWQATPRWGLSAGRARRVETMVEHAMTYVGHEYVWGGAGRPHEGVDCSGLVLQCLYRAGLDPQPISVDRHVEPTYRTSYEFYRHPRLVHAPLARARRGDLVFYRNTSTGRINHVAIYLGDGRLVEAMSGPNVVRVAPLKRTLSTQSPMPEVVRPFPV